MNASANSSYATRLSLVVALGGFLMGFDSAVISGTVDPVKAEFGLDPDSLGWFVSCLTVGATLAMAVAGPLADRFGRRALLLVTAALFTLSAVGCAVADSYDLLVWARIIGGLAVGGALLIAPIYIAEIAPPERRGQLVSFNQLNIVLGFSAAFFSNYFLELGGFSWRWMLGVEAIPAALYGLMLFTIPQSPRWLAARGRDQEALAVLSSIQGAEAGAKALEEVRAGLQADQVAERSSFRDLFQRRMTRVLVIGLGLGFFQQITGINAIFYYSTTIFSLAGAERDAALWQAILVGLVNVAFTLVAMRWIDRLGRKPLLMIGSAMMAMALAANGFAFRNASYEVTEKSVVAVQKDMPSAALDELRQMQGGESFVDARNLAEAVRKRAAKLDDESKKKLEGCIEDLAKASMKIDSTLVLLAIMAYIAAFAISLGPVMWAMFSEIFPQRVRGAAISLAGFFNSAVSFGVQQLFPRGLETMGPANVFFVFGAFAALAFFFSWRIVPETKGRSLEEIERELAS